MIKNNKQKKAEPVSSGGDLMSALRDRIGLRRKAITTGKGGGAGDDGGDAEVNGDLPPESDSPDKRSSVASAIGAKLLASARAASDDDSDDGDWSD